MGFFQKIRDLMNLCPKLDSIEFGPHAGQIRESEMPIFSQVWQDIASHLRHLKIVMYDDLRGKPDLTRPLYLEHLNHLESLSLEVLNVEEMDIITRKNPGLKLLKLEYMMGGFKYLARLYRLEDLRIGQLQSSSLSPSEEDIRSVLQTVGGSLKVLRLSLCCWNRSWSLVPNYSTQLIDLGLKVVLNDPHAAGDFKQIIAQMNCLKRITASIQGLNPDCLNEMAAFHNFKYGGEFTLE